MKPEDEAWIILGTVPAEFTVHALVTRAIKQARADCLKIAARAEGRMDCDPKTAAWIKKAQDLGRSPQRGHFFRTGTFSRRPGMPVSMCSSVVSGFRLILSPLASVSSSPASHCSACGRARDFMNSPNQ
jgi:hypothetical protein